MQQYGKKGVSVDALVRRQIEKAKASGRKISYAEAHEEVIADSMETMLTDGKVLEKLQMLQTKDKSLFERIKSAIAELVNKIKKAYKNVKPETLEGQIVASMLNEIETIQQMFVDAKEKHSMRYTTYKGLNQVSNWVRLKFTATDPKKLAMRKFKNDNQTDFLRHFLDFFNLMNKNAKKPCLS